MADSSKKRKMSKADKEKIKKEEQERKAQEEAPNSPDLTLNVSNNSTKPKLSITSVTSEEAKAARIKAIEEAKKQQKVEAAQAIEKAKQENEERRCRREDMTELRQMLDADKQQLQEINQNRRVQAKWARYMRCDGSPDPVNQGEINTYINLRMEDNSRDDAESVLKDSELTLGLIDELQFILSDTPHEELSEKEKNLYLETVSELENLIGHKLDLATLNVLCDVTTMANSETGNLQHTIQNDQISLSVWGNLVKNPRIRSFEFPGMRFTFDIPRVLTLSDCAVALQCTKFDHLSPYSKSAIPRRKKKEEEEIPVEENAEQKEEQEVDEEKKEGEGGEDGENAEGDEEKSEEKEETEIDLMAALRGEETEVKEEEPQEEEEAYEEDFEYPATPEPTEWEDFEEDDDIVDLRANDVLGGVFKLSLLHMPPQPKTLGKWTITQLVVPPELRPMDYVAEAPAQNTEGGTAKDAKDNKDKKDEKTPIQISTVLPKDVMFLEEPIVARWDKKKKMWSTDGFFDFNYNEDARTFSFKTLRFGTMCFLQDSHINMPFQSWEIRPHKVNSCLLTIIAAIVEIEIEIKDALCCLSQPKDKPELDSIRNKWVTPSELIVMLKRAGINVFPNEDSSKYVNIQNKHPNIEQSMYQQMALTASAMAYSWSKWNGQTEREHVVFQAAEALEDEPLLEEDWSVFLATKQRVTKLKMTEFDDSFSQEPTDEDTFTIASGNMSNYKLRNMSTYSTAPSKRVLPSNTASTASNNIRSRSRTSSAKWSKKAGAKLLSGIKKIDEVEEEEAEPKLFEVYCVDKSEFKSNIYHMIKAHGTDMAKDRIKETNYQFVDCVHQLLKATQVLTYA